jgi:hypothetical protein
MGSHWRGFDIVRKQRSQVPRVTVWACHNRRHIRFKCGAAKAGSVMKLIAYETPNTNSKVRELRDAR